MPNCCLNWLSQSTFLPARYIKHFHCYTSSLTISNVARFFSFINVVDIEIFIFMFSFVFILLLASFHIGTSHSFVKFLLMSWSNFLSACLFPYHFQESLSVMLFVSYMSWIKFWVSLFILFLENGGFLQTEVSDFIVIKNINLFLHEL